MLGKIREAELFIFDIDGVVCDDIDKGNILPKIPETVGILRKAGKRVAFLSNITRKTHTEVFWKIKGIAQSPEEIFTAGRICARWIEKQKPQARVFVITEGGLYGELERANVRIVWEKPVDFVVVGMKRNMSWSDLCFAIDCVMDGAQLVGVGQTKYFKGEFAGIKGVFPGDVAICNLIRFVTGKNWISIGKPHPITFQTLLSEFDVPPSRCVMIGDKLETDIAGANKLGILSIHISSKIGFEGFGEKGKPDLSLRSTKELFELFKKTFQDAQK